MAVYIITIFHWVNWYISEQGRTRLGGHRLRHLSLFVDLNGSPWAAFFLNFIGISCTFCLFWISFDLAHMLFLSGINCGMINGPDW